jgi:hypothetical protein
VSRYTLFQAPAGTGSVRGRVTVTAPLPPGVLKVTTDEKVCGMSVADETIVSDKSGGIAHAVVAIKGLAWGRPSPGVHVVNKGCRFVPHVTVAQPGAVLEVTSEDPTLHTTHLYAPDNQSLFNIALPMPGIIVRRPLQKSTGPLRMACDTHPWMRGFVVVSGDRSVVTGLDGVFNVADVPPGRHEISVWHESLQASPQTVSVSAGQATDVTFALVRR